MAPTLRGYGRPLAELFAGEQERWVLWAPVALGLGIAFYFALPAEPALWTGAASLIGSAFAAWLTRRSVLLAIPLAACALMAAGFTATQWRTQTMRAPMIAEPLIPAQLVGRVVSVEALTGANRAIVERLRISRLGPDKTPDTIRLTLRGEQPSLHPGDWISLRAGVMPLPAPAAPGAWDFQRQSYFNGLGGIAFSLGRAEITASVAATDGDTFALVVARLRQEFTEHIRDSIGGTPGAVAAALITGERGAIPADLMDAMRDAGLAHLLAISGLNIGLVAALLFAGTRAVLALVQPLALAFPIKKWAAIVALIGALAYTVISGGTVPAVRSFLMIGLVLAGVLFDRRGISMRSVAWAAMVILIIEPESLLGASFQLSFAAVIALIAAYEAMQGYRRRFGDFMPGWSGKIALYMVDIALTTGIAGMATAPFAIYHFNRYAAYGLAANMIAIPLTSLWIMPWAVIAVILMPFGLDGPAFRLMGMGIEGVNVTAAVVAGWSGAVAQLPAMPVWGLAAVSLGGLWICLWRGRWRLLGSVAVVAGMATLLVVRLPDILIDAEGKLLAVKTEASKLALSSPRADRFVQASWLRLAGQEETPAYWPAAGASEDGRLSCDALGCLYRAEGKVAALVQQAEALAEDCWSVDVVISLSPVRRDCPNAAAVIDRFDLWRNGAHALWLSGSKIRIQSVNGERGERPWVVRPDRSKGPPGGS